MIDNHREINDQSCFVCQKPSCEDASGEGKHFEVQGKRVFVCGHDVASFTLGLIVGQHELNQRVISVISNMPDDATGYSLRQQVWSLVPFAKRQTMERQRMFLLPARSPRDIHAELEKTVVGQPTAKRQVSLAVYEHVRSVRNNTGGGISPDRHNILLLGPSGCGKTLLAQTVARSLELPFVTADATAYSPTGFQGADSETMIHDLLFRAQGVVAAAERGVVFVDELDKIATYQHQGGKSESLNYGTQGTLLKLVEGKKVKVPMTLSSGDNSQSAYVTVDTSRILFFFGGAFPGLADIVAKHMGYTGRRIGFTTQNDGSAAMEEAVRNYEILSQAGQDVLVQSLIDYGLTAELVGRIPSIVALAPLSGPELRQCLLNVEHSPALRLQRTFSESGFVLEFDSQFVDAVVNQAHRMATGTRALTALVKRATSCASFDLLTDGGAVHPGARVIITPECINDPARYQVEPLVASMTMEGGLAEGFVP